MRHLTYLGLLAACLAGTLPLEVVLRADVYRRWQRAALAVLPPAAVFIVWDVVAVASGWWSFDPRYVLTVSRVGNLPVEELLFFLVVPICAVLTLEAVRRLRPSWPVDAGEPAVDGSPRT